jgi:hypothetical protein
LTTSPRVSPFVHGHIDFDNNLDSHPNCVAATVTSGNVVCFPTFFVLWFFQPGEATRVLLHSLITLHFH